MPLVRISDPVHKALKLASAFENRQMTDITEEALRPHLKRYLPLLELAESTTNESTPKESTPEYAPAN